MLNTPPTLDLFRQLNVEVGARDGQSLKKENETRIVFVSSDAHDPEYRSSMQRFVDINPPHYRDARALAWPEKYPEPEERDETILREGESKSATTKENTWNEQH
jgi:hypothetical protein